MMGPYPVNAQDSSFHWQGIILIYKANKDAAFIDIAIPLSVKKVKKSRYRPGVAQRVPEI
jgi:hypothetical protein